MPTLRALPKKITAAFVRVAVGAAGIFSILLAGALVAGCFPDGLHGGSRPPPRQPEWLSDFSFSPDGRALAFTHRANDGEDRPTVDSVGLMDVESGAFTRLRLPGSVRAAAPSFSPDGGALALEVNFGETPATHRLALLDLKSMRYRLVSPPNGELLFRPETRLERTVPVARNTPRTRPVFSPDGKRLLYGRKTMWRRSTLESLIAGGETQFEHGIWEMDLQSGDEGPVGGRDFHLFLEFASPPEYYGDDKIVFSAWLDSQGGARPRAGRHQIYMLDRRNPGAADDLRPLFTDESFPAGSKVGASGDPAVSADGKILMRVGGGGGVGGVGSGGVEGGDDGVARNGVALWDGGGEPEVLWLGEDRVIPRALSPGGGTAVVSKRLAESWLLDVAGGEMRKIVIPPQEEWRTMEAAEAAP